MPSSAAARRESWFRSGVHAINCLIDDFGDQYVCPLCLRPFDHTALHTELTIEHVPPESLGGKELVLTCRDCNSHAGHTIDAHARRQDVALGFLTGSARGTAPVTIIRNGVPLRANMTYGDGAIAVEGVDRAVCSTPR
jgi:hypothetical protein